MTTPNTPHLEAQLQSDMDLIRSKVLEMASLDEKALARALQSFLKRDRQIAYSVILRDQDVDQLETELDKLCLTFLLRHQPAAGHLRFIYSASKIVKELERIGDYAESIARQVLPLSSMEVDFPAEGFAELAHHATLILHDAVHAFLEGKAELARAAMSGEPRVRDMREVLATHLQAWCDQGRLPVEAHGPLTTVMRRFERVMEQAVNICEEAIYSATGEYLKHPPRQGYRVLFVGDTNTYVSQVAEAIARDKGYPKLSFASAGISSGFVDPRALRYMAKKGYNLTGHASKRVEQVPDLDQVQVAIALTKEAEQAFPLLPRRALKLTWFVPEPKASPDDETRSQMEFDHLFQELETHIQDLANAILHDDKD